MLTLEEKLQAYQNFINNTNIEMKRRLKRIIEVLCQVVLVEPKTNDK